MFRKYFLPKLGNISLWFSGFFISYNFSLESYNTESVKIRLVRQDHANVNLIRLDISHDNCLESPCSVL